VHLTVRWYDELGCTDFLGATGSQVLDTSVTDTWRWTRAESISPPMGANSAGVDLYVTKEQSSGTLDIHFDDVYFGPAGTIGEIFRDGFESGDVSEW